MVKTNVLTSLEKYNNYFFGSALDFVLKIYIDMYVN